MTKYRLDVPLEEACGLRGVTVFHLFETQQRSDMDYPHERQKADKACAAHIAKMLDLTPMCALIQVVVPCAKLVVLDGQ
jgi:hypothetical protein